MKKLISFIIIVAIVIITGMNTVMAYSTMNNTQMKTSDTMQDKMRASSMNCCKNMQGEGGCEKVAYKCCLSPFSDSTINSNIHNTNSKKDTIKGKIFDFGFLSLLQEDLDGNYIDRLNSPPVYRQTSQLDSFYITLTGSIKSNC